MHLLYGIISPAASTLNRSRPPVGIVENFACLRSFVHFSRLAPDPRAGTLQSYLPHNQ